LFPNFATKLTHLRFELALCLLQLRFRLPRGLLQAAQFGIKTPLESWTRFAFSRVRMIANHLAFAILRYLAPAFPISFADIHGRQQYE
jgi:hypothetical protein